jgi:hypothetical protein
MVYPAVLVAPRIGSPWCVDLFIRRHWFPNPECRRPTVLIGTLQAHRRSNVCAGHAKTHTVVGGKHSLVSPMGVLNKQESQPASDDRDASGQDDPAAAQTNSQSSCSNLGLTRA